MNQVLPKRPFARELKTNQNFWWATKAPSPSIQIFLKMKKIILILILVLAFLLRIILLDQIPPGLNHDEVSIGLDAYSLLKTGQDEYGKTFPIAFTAGEARPPLYVYLTIPFIWAFGLSTFSIRILSVLSGTLTVLITYFIAKKIFNSKIALLSAIFFALSPWHLSFSRMAMEATLALIFFSLAVLFFLHSFKNSKFFILTSLFLILSFFSYYNYQLLAPLFFLIFLFLKKEIFKNKKILILTSLPWVAGAGLFLWAVHFQNALFRFLRINITATQSTITVLIELIKNYFLTFSPKFLLLDRIIPFSENLRQKAGVFLPDYLFFLIGFIFLLKLLKTQKKLKYLILILWLLFSPLPSIIIGVPESQRNLILTPVFYILVAQGVIFSFNFLTKKSKTFSQIFFILFFSFYVFCFLSFAKYYFTRYSIDYAHFWAVPWQEGYPLAQKNKAKYQKIFFTDLFDHNLRRYAVEQKVNPKKIQQIIDHPTSIGELTTKFLDGFYFIQTESAKKENLQEQEFKNSLIIDFTGLFSSKDFSQSTLHNHYLKNGSWAYQTIEIF